jgi:hypothetical protein
MPTERPFDEPATAHITLTEEPSTERLTAPPQMMPPTELRVHGVSGSPVEDMLDRHIVGQVAGDRGAGFFRPRTEYGATLGPGGARLEGYRWGNLTSGAAARAFWLLLLPFSLANVVIWMRPPATGMGRRIVHGISRLFALSMSGTFTFAAIGVCLDLVAWQCGAPESKCTVDRPWLSWLFTGFFEPTGRRLAIATLGPIALISLLWYLSYRTWARYESFENAVHNPDGDGLATPTFWQGRAQVGRLRSLHVAAMFAMVDAMLLWVLLRHDMNTDAYAGVDLGQLAPATVVNFGKVLALATAAVLVLSVLLLLTPPIVDRVAKSKLASIVCADLRWISLLVTVLTLAYALVPRATWTIRGPLPGYGNLITLLFAGQSALLALLMLVVLFQRHRAKGALLGGFGAPIFGSLGLGLGAAFSAGVSYRVADYLDGNAVPSPAAFGSQAADQLRLQPPLSYQWAAFGFVFLFLVLVLSGLWVLLVTRPVLRRRARPETDDDYRGGRDRDKARAEAIDKAIANAKMTDRVTRPIAVAWLFIALGGVAATGLAVIHKGPVQLAGTGTEAARVLSFITNLGTYLISLTALLLVLLGIQTYRNPRVRRTVGVIWDLATFWPRASHPLAPPCYAERVVPELVFRANWLATQQGGVVLSGHSQGSVLVAATVLQMPKEALPHTALITYGSPLCRLYMRAFPNYFNENVLGEIAEAVAGDRGQERWVNLWRRTDPIGGAVGIGDRRLADPTSFDPRPGDRLPPAVEAHSGYQVTPEFGQAMDDLVGLLPPGALDPR